MTKYTGFNYKDLDSLRKTSEELGLDLRFSDDTDVLKDHVWLKRRRIHNSIALLPMEGCDSCPDGSPDVLTRRRYERFSKSMAGLIWFEAVAISHEARANPRQLYINPGNCDRFKELSGLILNRSFEENEGKFIPLLIMQITHSGRYCRPDGRPAPVIAARDPVLDSKIGLGEDYPVITDDELERLEDDFAETAVLAEKAGFHGVDIKSCHGYLLSELLSAHTRKGRYGGSFEGRTRFLRNVAGKIRARLNREFIVTTRINIYDAVPYPYGFGTGKEGAGEFDPREPVQLVRGLHDDGMEIINLTMGNPYHNPHVNRPFDICGDDYPEHPLIGVSRLINGIGEIQRAVPGIAVVGTGYSYLREYAPNLAAGTLLDKKATIVGFGREAFAYPEFARDIFESGRMKKNMCCIACGKCSELMRMGGRTGCVIRDKAVYGKIFRERSRASVTVPGGCDE